MRVLVPFDARDPKTRLASALAPDERARVARAMLRDVLDAIGVTDHEPRVLATGEIDCALPVTVDARPLTEAVNAVLDRRDEPTAVVMADLALATPDALESLFAPTADVVLAPGLGGGTNALVARHPDFRVDYHGCSYRDHRAAAERIGADTETIDSFRLAVDVDDAADLVEVLVHTDGDTARVLRDIGFELSTADGHTTLDRSSENDAESA